MSQAGHNQSVANVSFRAGQQRLIQIEQLLLHF